MQNSNTEPNPELFEQHYQYQKAKRRRELFKFAAVIIMGLAIASAMSVGYIYYARSELSKQIPLAIRDNIDFPVYLPGQSKFQSDESSFKYSNGILLFLSDSVDTHLTFTEQKKPADFDLGKFSNNEGLTDLKALTINTNKALLGKVRGLNVAIVDTGQTIVTITGTDTQSSETIESVLYGLQKI